MLMTLSDPEARDAKLAALRLDLDNARQVFMDALSCQAVDRGNDADLPRKAAAYAEAVRRYRWAMLAEGL